MMQPFLQIKKIYYHLNITTQNVFPLHKTCLFLDLRTIIKPISSSMPGSIIHTTKKKENLNQPWQNVDKNKQESQ